MGTVWLRLDDELINWIDELTDEQGDGSRSPVMREALFGGVAAMVAESVVGFVRAFTEVDIRMKTGTAKGKPNARSNLPGSGERRQTLP